MKTPNEQIKWPVTLITCHLCNFLAWCEQPSPLTPRKDTEDEDHSASQHADVVFRWFWACFIRIRPAFPSLMHRFPTSLLPPHPLTPWETRKGKTLDSWFMKARVFQYTLKTNGKYYLHAEISTCSSKMCTVIHPYLDQLVPSIVLICKFSSYQRSLFSLQLLN